MTKNGRFVSFHSEWIEIVSKMWIMGIIIYTIMVGRNWELDFVFEGSRRRGLRPCVEEGYL